MTNHKYYTTFYSLITIVVAILALLTTNVSYSNSSQMKENYILKTPFATILRIPIGISPDKYLDTISSCIVGNCLSISKSEEYPYSNLSTANYVGQAKYSVGHADIVYNNDTLLSAIATFYNGRLYYLEGLISNQGLVLELSNALNELYGDYKLVKKTIEKTTQYYRKWDIKNGYILLDYDTNKVVQNILNTKYIVSSNSNFYANHLISDSSLDYLDYYDIQDIIDDIHAHRGYNFDENNINSYDIEYAQKHWYKPLSDNSKIIFNSIEKKNLDKLISYKNNALKLRKKYIDEISLLKKRLFSLKGNNQREELKKVFLPYYNNTYPSFEQRPEYDIEEEIIKIANILKYVHISDQVLKEKVVTCSTIISSGFYYLMFDINKVVLGYSDIAENDENNYLDYDKIKKSNQYLFRLRGNQLCLELF